MKRIVLFRFHKNFTVCENRLRLLRRYNPGIEIFGLYGGAERGFQRAQRQLSPHMDGLYCISGKSEQWKWKNSDLAVRLWYTDCGSRITFDILHVIEWDLLLFESLQKLCQNIPGDGVGLTDLTELRYIEKTWAPWTVEEPHRTEWTRLQDYVRHEFNYNQEPYAGSPCGAVLPRTFLEKYRDISVPELCHDELRLPLFSQILGFRLYDTGFYGEESFFSWDKEIPAAAIEVELLKPLGRRVFHPYCGVFSLDEKGNWRGDASRRWVSERQVRVLRRLIRVSPRP